MKKYLLSAVMMICSLAMFAQKETNQTAVIQTNGVCGMCETRFMENVPHFKGVVDVSYDAKTAQLTVVFSPKKTTIDAIRKGISDLGYNADDVAANPEARKKLPACCRVDKSPHSGCGHHH